MAETGQWNFGSTLFAPGCIGTLIRHRTDQVLYIILISSNASAFITFTQASFKSL